jgi:hypothetical protein
MIEVNTREFTRRFAEIKARASKGEPVRLKSREGTFLFQRESDNITSAEFLERLETLHQQQGFWGADGAENVEEAKRKALPASNPWD